MDNKIPVALDKWELTLTARHNIWKGGYDVTCRYGAGAGNTGLSRAASCGCCDQPDIVESAAWHLNLLHIRLACDGNDGLKLGATDSAHRDGLHWFHVLTMFRRKGEVIRSKRW